ncbi:hypothetical protein COT12_01390 [Candidatus Berkelbacteria bacterium CG08_land_8_20_14_0_20_39_8]|uniref:DUF11 domain-containing protein n=1 Tax=Candidatus Berkelbacteria bacterium CG08_land_8_20_14_0_20_39_8 TaxID=1974511 RepID=A0A2M6YCD7_9BACT|nr:MAG: hypothetical protein COT12_01390 [Candidatus Berkelbacteria bacterium CG08_land_8_20_14_0_20_39_8]
MNMRKIFSKIGKTIKDFVFDKKKMVAAVAVATTVATGVFGLQAHQKAVATGTPRFNFLQGDAEMLRVAKVSDSTWGDPINANVGDKVAFLLYFHNGMVDTTAHNTRVRVDLPIDQTSQLNMKSYIWSDETAYITDTVVDSKIVGHTGATINLPSHARIQYIPGSTMIFKNGATVGTQIADGITTNSGVNIGNINGCWQYSGYVTFQANLYGQSNIAMNKQVAHAGDTTWKEEIAANPGDEIAYKIGVRNNGDIDATKITVKDVLPQYMTSEAGTTYLYTKDHPKGIKVADSLYTTGLSLPNVAPGDAGVEYIVYKTRISSSVPAGSWELINTAKVFECNVEKAQDQAKVVVTANRGLIIDKKVAQGDGWAEQNTAKLGDTITYRIIVRNTGNVADCAVRVKDILPTYVNYIAGTTKVNGVKVSDQIIASSGLLIGDLAPGASKTITLQGKIYGCPPVGGYNLTNTGYTWAEGVNQISDTAITTVNVVAPVSPSTK